jgi:hypothetical protein
MFATRNRTGVAPWRSLRVWGQRVPPDNFVTGPKLRPKDSLSEIKINRSGTQYAALRYFVRHANRRNRRTLEQATEERSRSDARIKVVLIIRSSIQVVDDDVVRIDPVSC